MGGARFHDEDYEGLVDTVYFRLLGEKRRWKI